jgi:hypothetical protein
MTAYSVVITSCGRFDLLRATLASLLPNLDVRPQKIIIVEDSCDPAVKSVAAEFDGDFEILVNDVKQGQIASIDRAYRAVSTPYIFHCEDDWEFFRTGFITESAALLQHVDKVSMVGLRPREELNPLIRKLPVERTDHVDFFQYDPALHPEYFSYSFNPGLRRLRDYEKFGPFAPLGHEPDISYVFKKAGFRMAGLENPAVRHIGWGRHIQDPYQPKRSKGLVHRLRKSVGKRVKRVARRTTELLRNSDTTS